MTPSFPRAASSFYSSNEPLYVLDDSPIPADTGLYGMRGANGVIVITTKKPGKRRG